MKKMQTIWWTEPQIADMPGRVPTIWADCNIDPGQSAIDVWKQTRGLPHDDCYFWLGGALYGDPGSPLPPWLGTAGFAELLLSGPPGHGEHSLWFAKFWAAYFVLGGTVTRALMDVEARAGSSLMLWGRLDAEGMTDASRVDVMRRVYEGPARAMLPPSLIQLKAEDFASQFDGAAAWTEWNNFAVAWLAARIREAVVMPAQNLLERAVDVLNYADTRLEYDVYDYNNWTMKAPGASVGQWSAPALYNWETGQRYDGRTGATTDARFQQLIDNQTVHRSCVAATNGKASAFHSYPSFPYVASNPPTAATIAARRWLWQQNVLHCRAGGQTVFLNWNPVQMPIELWREDMEFAARVYAQAAAMDATPGKRAALDLRSTSFATDGFTTHYADFLTATGR